MPNQFNKGKLLTTATSTNEPMQPLKKIPKAILHSIHCMIVGVLLVSCGPYIKTCTYYEIIDDSLAIETNKFDGECKPAFRNHNTMYFFKKDETIITLSNSGRWSPGLFARIEPQGDGYFEFETDSVIVLQGIPGFPYRIRLSNQNPEYVLKIKKVNKDNTSHIVDSLRIKVKLIKSREIAFEYI